MTCGRVRRITATSRPVGLVEVGLVERVGVVVGRRVGHARVAVAEHHDLVEPDRSRPTRPARRPQLGHDGAFSSSGVSPWNGWPWLAQGRVLEVALLAAGAAHQHGVHALGVVPGERRGALRRLVVGVGVHGEETEAIGHCARVPTSAGSGLSGHDATSGCRPTGRPDQYARPGASTQLRRDQCRRSSLLVGATLSGCDTNDGRQMREPTSSQRAAVPTTTSSTLPGVPITPVDLLTTTTSSSSTSTSSPSAAGSVSGAFSVTGPWVPGDSIPVDQTCDGADAAPLIAWTHPRRAPWNWRSSSPIPTPRTSCTTPSPDSRPPTAVSAAPPSRVRSRAPTTLVDRAGTGPAHPRARRTPTCGRCTRWPSRRGSSRAARVAVVEQLVETSAFASSQFTGIYTRRD